jgi:HSP20 family molecular chaperone IbpA
MVNLAPTFSDTFRANGLVSDLLDNFLKDPIFGENDFEDRNSSEVKVTEEPKRYIIQFPVPGYNRHSLQLKIEGNNIRVRGNMQKSNQVSQTDEQTSNQYFQLYSYTLPQDANTEKVKAVCQNGLLEVFVAKHRAISKSKVIRVTNGNMVDRRRLLNKRWSWGISLWRKLKQAIKLKRGRKKFPSLFKSTLF